MCAFICTNRYWKQINETRDIYGQEVRIVHSTEFRQVSDLRLSLCLDTVIFCISVSVCFRLRMHR